MLTLVLLAFACTAPDSAQGGDSATSDTSVGVDDTGSEPGDCLAFHGIRSASSSWVYHWDESTSFDSSSINTIAVSSYDPGAGTAVLTERQLKVESDGSYVYDINFVMTYFCNETGLYLDHYEGHMAIESDSGIDEQSWEVVYDTESFIRPGKMALGDTWQQTASWTQYFEDGSEPRDGAFDYSYEVVEADYGEGEWSGFLLERTTEKGKVYEHYFMPDVGEWKLYQRNLVSYTP